jgi:mannose-1-phosphate guanylyltransferase/mannose-6-phosphate isomerase
VRIVPVILSGGSGSRLWPLSREHYPKQFLALAAGQTLLQQTVARVSAVPGAAAPLVVCNEEHRFLVAEQLRRIAPGAAAIILEPTGRNTAPATTLAAFALRERSPDTVMLVTPSDHAIGDIAAFHLALQRGGERAATGKLVTFGVPATAAETGYGYIRREEDDRVAEFVEKPDAPTAARYVASGAYLWNSGMFMMRPEVWLAELGQFRPDVLDACERAWSKARKDGDFLRVDTDVFRACPSVSIDHAVMERTRHAVVIPLAAGWSDIGSWSAIWHVSSQDASGNAVMGDVYVHDTRNSLVISCGRLVATIGLRDAVVIETADAVLVADKERAQDVREIVQRLETDRRSQRLHHRRVHRPWGSYETLDSGARFQVKRLVIEVGAAISLQRHRHRAEHWVVVRGKAQVTRGAESVILTENESTYIPAGMKHRLENQGDVPLEIIEVQSGGYLGEDDIERFEDRYNRHTGG